MSKEVESHHWNTAEKVGVLALIGGTLIASPSIAVAGGFLLAGGHLFH